MIKNPQKAKKVFFSFLRVEVKLALAILFEGWDFSTDTLFLVKNVLQAEPKNTDAISDLVTPWVIAYAFAVVASTIAIFIKVREFWQQLRYRRRYLESDEDGDVDDGNDEAAQSATSKRGKLMKHTMRLQATSRKIKLMLAGLLVAICECLPLGILQIVYSNRIEEKLQTIDMLSTVTSWLMFGLKISAPTMLFEHIKYKRKQQHKIQHLELVERPGRNAEASIEMGTEQVQQTD